MANRIFVWVAGLTIVNGRKSSARDHETLYITAFCERAMKVKNSSNFPGVERGVRLARKRYSFRLPLELASRLEALSEMNPQKTRTQLVADLLGLGLAELERVWSQSATGLVGFHPDTKQPIYLPTGPFAEFHGLTRRHHLAMEHELAKDDPEPPYPVDEYALGDVE